MATTTAPDPAALLEGAGDLPALLNSMAAHLAAEIAEAQQQWQQLKRLGGARDDCAQELLRKRLRRPLDELATQTGAWLRQLDRATDA